MENIYYERYDKAWINDKILHEAAQLFSENCGVWTGNAGPVLAGSTKAGRRVRASRERLRTDYLVDGALSVYVRVTVDGCRAGHVLACRWDANGRTVCWVTQLVVRRAFRQRGLAAGLLSVLRQDGDDVYRIMSSHPAACLAAAKAFGRQHHQSHPTRLHQKTSRFDPQNVSDTLRQGGQTPRQPIRRWRCQRSLVECRLQLLR